MKYGVLIILFGVLLSCGQSIDKNSAAAPNPKEKPPIETPSEEVNLTLEMANQLSQLAFACIDQEYPNKLNQVLGDESYLHGPQTLHPTFYGCFDWHSAVHGHWTLIKLLKEFPDLDNRAAIIQKIDKNLTPSNIEIELAYFDDKHNKNFERTYGWAWLLKLAEELYTWDDPLGLKWYNTLEPMTQFFVKKYAEFLPKLNYPIRVGEHSNTAFGVSFAYDYATQVNDTQLLELIESRAMQYYGDDQGCPLTWEPSGFDFLSPCIQEAEIMAKVIMDNDQYNGWLTDFLPDLSMGRLQPAVASDLSDGKLVHIVGLNFSRAWCLYNMARKTGEDRYAAMADTHVAASMGQVINGQYAGEHWLASFAVMALTSK